MGPDKDMKFPQEVMEIVSYDINFRKNMIYLQKHDKNSSLTVKLVHGPAKLSPSWD